MARPVFGLGCDEYSSLAVLTCADVVGRYFLSRPIFGAFELTEMLLAALIFAGLPLVTLRNEHVTVDVFDPITPDWLFRIQHVVACALGLLSTGYLAWRLWIRALSMDSAGETTAQLKLAIAPFVYGMSVLCAVTAVVHLMLMLRPVAHHHIGVEAEGPL